MKSSTVHNEEGTIEKVDISHNSFKQVDATTKIEGSIKAHTVVINQHPLIQDDSTQPGGSKEQKESGTKRKGDVTQPGGSLKQKKSETEGKEWVILSSNIGIFKENPISKQARVFRGEMPSEITGTRKLAVKFIEHNEENVKEAKILEKLELHPNVVKIFHSDIYPSHPVDHMYIAMELCHEQNLRQIIEENKANDVPFDPVMMNSYAEQVVEGLRFIHEEGILHKDLKLDNLLLSPDKKFLKICDFGFSKELRWDHTVTKQTGFGTFGYMAPETLTGQEVSKMSDIYSLGIVIHQLWSYGLHPFGNDPDDWNSNIKKNKDRDLSQILVPNKKDATDLLEKVLEFKPRQRPTAAEIQKHDYFRRKDVETAVLPQHQVTTGSLVPRRTSAGRMGAIKRIELREIYYLITGYLYKNNKNSELGIGFCLREKEFEQEVKSRLENMGGEELAGEVRTLRCKSGDVIKSHFSAGHSDVGVTFELNGHELTIDEDFDRETFTTKFSNNWRYREIDIDWSISVHREEQTIEEQILRFRTTPPPVQVNAYTAGSSQTSTAGIVISGQASFSNVSLTGSTIVRGNTAGPARNVTQASSLAIAEEDDEEDED